MLYLIVVGFLVYNIYSSIFFLFYILFNIINLRVFSKFYFEFICEFNLRENKKKNMQFSRVFEVFVVFHQKIWLGIFIYKNIYFFNEILSLFCKFIFFVKDLDLGFVK